MSVKGYVDVPLYCGVKDKRRSWGVKEKCLKLGESGTGVEES